MPTVTAVILTYDRLPLLKEAVMSVRWQTHGDIEIMVVANGSPPETIAWLESIRDPRITVVALPENISPPLARNEGWRKARGEWIANLDDDDVWAPDKVECLLAAAAATGRRWAYCGVTFIDPDTQVIAGRPLPDPDYVTGMLPVAYTVPGGLSAVMWHVNAFADDGLMDDLPYTGDWDISLRLMRNGPPARVDRPLVGYRQHSDSWSRGLDGDTAEFDRVVSKHSDMRGPRRAHWGEHYRYVAAHAGRSGDRRDAVRLYLKAIRHGDVRSIPRMFGAVLLPLALQRHMRRIVLSDADWLDESDGWLKALRVLTR